MHLRAPVHGVEQITCGGGLFLQFLKRAGVPRHRFFFSESFCLDGGSNERTHLLVKVTERGLFQEAMILFEWTTFAAERHTSIDNNVDTHNIAWEYDVMVRKMFIFLHPGADRNNGGSSFQTRERSHASSGPRSGAYSTVHSRSSGATHGRLDEKGAFQDETCKYSQLHPNVFHEHEHDDHTTSRLQLNTTMGWLFATGSSWTLWHTGGSRQDTTVHRCPKGKAMGGPTNVSRDKTKTTTRLRLRRPFSWQQTW